MKCRCGISLLAAVLAASACKPVQDDTTPPRGDTVPAEAKVPAGRNLQEVNVASYHLSTTAMATDISLLDASGGTRGSFHHEFIDETHQVATLTLADTQPLRIEFTTTGDAQYSFGDSSVDARELPPEAQLPAAVLSLMFNDKALVAALREVTQKVCAGAVSNIACAAAVQDCPWWVELSSCVACAACIVVGEAPPPCWAACVTCGACLGVDAGEAAAEWSGD